MSLSKQAQGCLLGLGLVVELLNFVCVYVDRFSIDNQI